MRVLSTRQPFADLILRSIKRIDYRSQPTHLLGEHFYLCQQSMGGSEAVSGWLTIADESGVGVLV